MLTRSIFTGFCCTKTSGNNERGQTNSTTNTEKFGRQEAAYFTLHHNLDLSRLNNIETIRLVALWRERERQFKVVCTVTIRYNTQLLDILLTCVMMRSLSENCFAPKTSTSFILSVAWRVKMRRGRLNMCHFLCNQLNLFFCCES